jgi:hypothetical protein
MFRPGSSPGRVVLLGDFVNEGTLEIEVDGLAGAGVTGGYDQVVVGGATTLGAQSVLRLTRSTGAFEPSRGRVAQILRSSGGINGTFGTVDNRFSTGLYLDLNDDPASGGYLYSTGQNKGLGVSGLADSNLNNKAILKSLSEASLVGSNQFDSATSYGNAFRGLFTSNNLDTFFAGISPEAYAGLEDYTLRVARNYTRNATGFNAVGSPSGTPGDVSGLSFFGGYTQFETAADSSDNQADYDLQSKGGIVGVRTPFGSKASLGAFFAVDEGSVDSSHLSSDVNGVVLGLFGEVPVALDDRLTFNGGFTYGRYSTDAERASYGGTATANGIDSQSVLGYVGVKYELIRPEPVAALDAKQVKPLGGDLKAGTVAQYFEGIRFSLVPEANFTVNNGTVDGFNEKSGTALKVSEQEKTSLLGEAAIMLSAKMTSKFTTGIRMGVTHDFADAERDVTAAFAAGKPFTVTAPGMGSTEFTVGVRASYQVTKKLVLTSSYGAGFAADSNTAHAFSIGAGYSF